MKKNLKNSLLFVILGIICVFMTDCVKETSLELPFDKDDIQSIELSKYLVQTELDNTVIEDISQLEQIYDVFDGLKIRMGKLEKKEDKETVRFKFNLKDGKDYEIIYYPIAVKKGNLVISNMEDAYITSSDIGGFANNALMK